MRSRELEILEWAATHPPSRWLSVAEIAQTIEPGCNGPRTAETYARELIFALSQRKCFEQSSRKELYRITLKGRATARRLAQAEAVP